MQTEIISRFSGNSLKGIVLCKLNAVEISALLDTGAQVPIISLQHVKNNLKGTAVRKIEDVLDPGANLELKTAIGLILPRVGRIYVKCELKGGSYSTGVINLPI